VGPGGSLLESYCLRFRERIYLQPGCSPYCSRLPRYPPPSPESKSAFVGETI
jgi:hypothetical protein